MKTNTFLISVGMATLLAIGCTSNKMDENGGNANYKPTSAPETNKLAEAEASLADSAPATDIVTSAAARIGKADSSRRFIRTAHLKFLTPDVQKSTLQIEDLVLANGGFVLHSQIDADRNEVSRHRISDDSVLVVNTETMEARLQLAVPCGKLDATLRQLIPFISHLDSRTVNAEDVSLQLRADALAAARNQRHIGRLTNDKDKRDRLRDKTEVSQQLLYAEQESDQALLDEVRLMDRVKYSEINLELYQQNGIIYLRQADGHSYRQYLPSYWRRLGSALSKGFQWFQEITLLIAHIWWVWFPMVIVAIYLVYRRKRSPSSPGR